MNNAIAWFEKHYHGADCKRIMIIPTNKLSKAAGFNKPVGIMRKKELSQLTHNIRSFFGEFVRLDLKSLSEVRVQELIDLHQLSVENLTNGYTKTTVPN